MMSGKYWRELICVINDYYITGKKIIGGVCVRECESEEEFVELELISSDLYECLGVLFDWSARIGRA